MVSIINPTEEGCEIPCPTLNLQPVMPEENDLKEENEEVSVGTVDVTKNETRCARVRKEIDVSYLNDEERLTLLEICEGFEDLFHLEGDKLKCTSMLKHRIPLEEGVQPIKVHRLLEVHKQDVRRQTAEMLEEGLIRPSRSSWNTPLLVVGKKPDADCTTRMRVVVDFRKLDEVTIGDSYPLPNI